MYLPPGMSAALLGVSTEQCVPCSQCRQHRVVRHTMSPARCIFTQSVTGPMHTHSKCHRLDVSVLSVTSRCFPAHCHQPMSPCSLSPARCIPTQSVISQCILAQCHCPVYPCSVSPPDVSLLSVTARCISAQCHQPDVSLLSVTA